MILDILIPTFNRGEDLIYNLNLLGTYISSIDQDNKIQIIISDNCSSDNTQALVKTFIEGHKTINIQYYRNSENIGLEKNAVEVLGKSTSDFIMWLGDDDYLPKGYLNFVFEQINSGEIGYILPRNSNILDKKEFKTSDIKQPVFELKEAGYNTMFDIGHFSHQMSGIVLKRTSLLENYLMKEDWRNVYLFMFFTNYCLLHYNGIFVEDYKVAITQGNVKAWSYDKAGLLPEVYKSYYYFLKDIGEEKVSNLIFEFTRRHTWRFGIEVVKPLNAYKRLEFLLSQILEISNIKSRLRSLFIKDFIYRIIR
ncbi:glycosyltransferase [Flammeovirga sp. EKP202]|uniref:glycosyltransferase n=1 Tax=Flammeovirga sp. EKP202 TaxID=2770592 RepID=UPI00165F6F7A|nr:glycosyltransferase family 2 protein [Flammeovirga sp. EKP202]MBD0400828.1 glycosyltransferase family 2 protein [Flammeovirga sp. EKP202]